MTKKELLKLLEKYRDEDTIYLQLDTTAKISFVVGKTVCSTEATTIETSDYHSLKLFLK